MKVFENKFGQVVEKSFEFVLCLFGFVKATKFRDSSEYSEILRSKCSGKELPPLSNLYVKQKNFRRARKSLGTSLALQCYAVLVSSGFFYSKVA